MPTTNFYTVSGRIKSQRTSADSVVTYLPDAAENITAARQGGKVSMATYTPLGRGVSPTGTALGWRGAANVQIVGLPQFTHLVRLTPYASYSGFFLSGSSNPEFEHRSYLPRLSTSTRVGVRNAARKLKFSDELCQADCTKGAYWTGCWVLDADEDRSNLNGWIIQTIVRVGVKCDCCNPILCAPIPLSAMFTEAWKVVDGKPLHSPKAGVWMTCFNSGNLPTSGDDQYALGNLQASLGAWAVIGTAKFFTDVEVIADPPTGWGDERPVKPGPPPSYFSRSGSDEIQHNWMVSWNCCGSNDKGVSQDREILPSEAWIRKVSC